VAVGRQRGWWNAAGNHGGRGTDRVAGIDGGVDNGCRCGTCRSWSAGDHHDRAAHNNDDSRNHNDRDGLADEERNQNGRADDHNHLPSHNDNGDHYDNDRSDYDNDRSGDDNDRDSS
jgi:hypothetical protein